MIRARILAGILAAAIVGISSGQSALAAPLEFDVRLASLSLEVTIGEGRDSVVVGSVPLVGPLYELRRQGNLVFVARGRAGLTVVDVADPMAPRVVSTVDSIGRVMDVELGGDGVVAVLKSGSRVRLTWKELRIAPWGQKFAERGSAIAPTLDPRLPRPGVAYPHVFAAQRGRVGLRGGTQAIHVGDRFALVGPPVDDPAAAAAPSVVRGVVAIEAVVDEVGIATLPRGVIASVGDIALPTQTAVRERLTGASPWQPITRIQVVARPAITSNGTGFGLIGEASIDHTFRRVVRLGVAFSPVGVLAQSNPDTVSGRITNGAGFGFVTGTIAIGNRYFELSASLGGELHSTNPSGFTYGFGLRGGSIDGFHVSTRFMLTALNGPNGPSGTTFGGFFGECEIPVRRRFNLALEAAGSLDWLYGSVGLKTYLRGSGGPGTLILHTGFGTVSISENRAAFGFGIKGVGPALVLGVDWRI